VLPGRGLCDELITRPEESYRLCCVVVCYLETSRMRRPWPALGRSATGGGGGRREVNIKIDLKETRREGVEWTHTAQDRDKRRAVVSRVMNLRFPQNKVYLWTS